MAVNEQQVKHWESVAHGWEAWLDWTERNFRLVTEWFIDAVGWRPGLRALDVACGAGYPVLFGASRVHPGGRQFAVDVSPAMVAAASRRIYGTRFALKGICG